MITSYVDQFHLIDGDDVGMKYEMVKTCGTESQHFSDLCFIINQDFLSDKSSKVVINIIDAIILILSAGFAFPVLQLFLMQFRNFLAGQTSIERLGK